MKLVAADGIVVKAAYANAWHVSQDLEGIRMIVTIENGELISKIYEEDIDTTIHIPETEINRLNSDMIGKIQSGDVDLCDDRQIDVWVA